MQLHLVGIITIMGTFILICITFIAIVYIFYLIKMIYDEKI